MNARGYRVMLTETDLIRYGRQIIYPGFGVEGQDKLKESHVVVAGLGGIGCAASMYLASAGVGNIDVVDCEYVECSNLNRQVLYLEDDLGKKKTLSAVKKLAKLNPHIKVTPIFKKITEENAIDIVRGAHIVIDGLDNFDTRFKLNAACVAEGVPFIHGGVHGLLGEVTTIIPGKTCCLACIFSRSPKTRSNIPVFGATPALVAVIQVMEAIKLISGFGSLLAGKMLYVDGEKMEFNLVNLIKRPDCCICGHCI
ncbi:ThiF family adenylyltransferase [Chloroflexota bacterium]